MGAQTGVAADMNSPGFYEKQIPTELKSLRQWVLWRSETREGQAKPTKVPYCPQGPNQKASVDKPETWATYEQAISVFRKGKGDGIGFVFTEQDPFVGVDLDDCRDPATGEIEGWAKEVIAQLGSYTECSPSGRGLHILAKGTLPQGGCRRGKIELSSP